MNSEYKLNKLQDENYKLKNKLQKIKELIIFGSFDFTIKDYTDLKCEKVIEILKIIDGEENE